MSVSSHHLHFLLPKEDTLEKLRSSLDSAGCFQVLINDKWARVPIAADALLVNLGDQMQIVSNGIFKSPVHGVVTNSERLRISAALFNETDPEKEIGPVDCLVDEQRPRLYRNVKNYALIYYKRHQKGKVAIETLKIS
ncbi:hypothetical protein Peur_007472 [Populus x canadensis]